MVDDRVVMGVRWNYDGIDEGVMILLMQFGRLGVNECRVWINCLSLLLLKDLKRMKLRLVKSVFEAEQHREHGGQGRKGGRAGNVNGQSKSLEKSIFIV